MASIIFNRHGGSGSVEWRFLGMHQKKHPSAKADLPTSRMPQKGPKRKRKPPHEAPEEYSSARPDPKFAHAAPKEYSPAHISTTKPDQRCDNLFYAIYPLTRYVKWGTKKSPKTNGKNRYHVLVFRVLISTRIWYGSRANLVLGSENPFCPPLICSEEGSK